ncbi:hypothetical protein Taro_034951 [Colocasia esculenta]|uniref:Uncharacterized protein n=1 Tax=Colocasia esculenta TaxID=4460 RepID=A0A843VSX3_COLES|nr:hypothetical protein [Colocasia esculenta]
MGGRTEEEVMQERTPQTSFLPIEPEIFGREKEKEEIIRFLLTSDDDAGGGGVVSSIAITGMGGLGKTTLAQLVYNDRKVVEYFKPRMWICTTPDYDVMKLSREILGSIGMDIKFPWSLGNLDMYQRVIMDKLEGKRFLLVLDNLWDKDQRKWQSLLAPLMYAKKGSKILITTRDSGFANVLQYGKTIELEGLPFDHCWKLFERHAFFDGTSAEHPRLEAIGKRIVDKFKGVPLAAAVVGDVLRSTLEENEWRRILENEIWEIDEGEDGILPVLKLSYDRLPPQLKQCLAYCSLFPKNYRFDSCDLVRQWMAQGFVQSDRVRRIEDVGNRCFNDLFNRSFFQLADGKYVVHDLIRDLTMLVSHCDHLSTDTDSLHRILRDNHNIRHLSLLMTSTCLDLEDLERLLACKSLRTLAFCFLSDSRCWVPRSLFLSLDTLRLLDLSYGGIEQLPDSIGNLRHLRYLDLGSNPIRILPESLCCLYKLQTLKLKGCCIHTKLPRGISQLINLRHLEVEPGPLSGVVGIGNLTCLQELELFPISKPRHGPKIDDLKGMNELRGSLCIQNLHWIRRKEEAMGAVLDRKQHLLKLKMEWNEYAYGGERNSELDQEILEALVPPAGLKEFAVEGYDGESAPSWLEQQSISNLESISLTTCRNWSSLPISLCTSSLKRITVSCCPQLRYLPSLPITLKELVLQYLKLEELPEFYKPAQPLSGHGSNIFPSLSTLVIEGCSALKSLRGGLLRLHLSNLTVLRIQGCRQLVEWPVGAGFLATLLSLQEDLCILGCPKLEAIPAGMALSPSLKRLIVKDSPEVVNEALLAQLHNLASESSVSVEKDYIYTHLASCYEQVFKLIVADWLEIGDIRPFYLHSVGAPEDDLSLHLTCAKQRVWSWRSNDWVHAWRVQIWPRRVKEEKKEGKKAESASNITIRLEEWWERRSPPQRYLPGSLGIFNVANNKQHECNSSVSACFGEQHLPWASSIRWLVMYGTFHGTILPFNMTSLEGLWISCFRGTVPLLPEALLSHLTGILELQIFDCPELTLSSLKGMISSLPSLQYLTIKRCPKLSSSSPSCTDSVAISSSNAAKLQTFFVDDAKLLGDSQFVCDYLRSLRGLHIWYDRNLTSFTMTMEEGLRSLGPSLQHLSFYNCGMLEHLPSDMRSLLPSLKALSIGGCGELWCLPSLLPAFLCILVLHECNRQLETWCNAPHPGRLVQKWQKQQTYWPKIAHIPVIVNNGFLVQGSYREYLELRAKWRDF